MVPPLRAGGRVLLGPLRRGDGRNMLRPYRKPTLVSRPDGGTGRGGVHGALRRMGYSRQRSGEQGLEW